MKQLNKRSGALVIAGTLLLSLGFIVKRYVTLSDGEDGLIKGISIGLLVLALIVSLKQRKRRVQV